MNRGVPPTPANARTGEFTPPGVTAIARANKAREAASGDGTFQCVKAETDAEQGPAGVRQTPEGGQRGRLSVTQREIERQSGDLATQR